VHLVLFVSDISTPSHPTKVGLTDHGFI